MPGGGCRAGRMASAGRCAYFYRLARPLPLGAGDYVRSAVIGSACGEGVGVSSRFSLSRCSSSCHLVAPVVIASLCLLRRPVLVVPCSHRSRLPCPMCFVPCPVALSSCPLVVLPCVLVWFLIASLPVLAISRAGRSVLACPCVVAFILFALLYRLVSPAFACLPSGLVHRSFSSFPILVSSSPLPLVSSCLIAPPPARLFSPSCDKRWRGGRRLVLCLLALVPRRAGGGRCRRGAWRLVVVCLPSFSSCGRRDSVGGAGLLLACLGWRAGDAVLSAVVVSGLCCRCLYI